MLGLKLLNVSTKKLLMEALGCLTKDAFERSSLWNEEKEILKMLTKYDKGNI